MITKLMNVIESMFDQVTLMTMIAIVIIIAIVSVARGKKIRLWWHFKRILWLWVLMALISEFVPAEAQIILMAIAVICALVWIVGE